MRFWFDSMIWFIKIYFAFQAWVFSYVAYINWKVINQDSENKYDRKHLSLVFICRCSIYLGQTRHPFNAIVFARIDRYPSISNPLLISPRYISPFYLWTLWMITTISSSKAIGNLSRRCMQIACRNAESEDRLAKLNTHHHPRKMR